MPASPTPPSRRSRARRARRAAARRLQLVLLTLALLVMLAAVLGWMAWRRADVGTGFAAQSGWRIAGLWDGAAEAAGPGAAAGAAGAGAPGAAASTDGLTASARGGPGSAPETLPQPVPLGRETRDPAAAATLAARQAADHERQLADSAAPRPGQEFSHARVTAQDIGLAFLPGAAPDPAHNSRTGEPGYGSTVSTQLVGASSLEAALMFYRRELRAQLAQAPVSESRIGPGLVTLSAGHATTRLTVLLDATGSGPLRVTLTRWSADAGAPSTAPAGAAAPRP